MANNKNLKIRTELASGATTVQPKMLTNLISANSFGNDLHTFILRDDVAVTTDGAGLLQSVFSNNPSSTSNWSGYAGVFDEYRILGVVLDFKRLFAVGGATTLFYAPVAHCIDRSDSTVLTSYDLALRSQDGKESNGNVGFRVIMPMKDVGESEFKSTASPVAETWIKFYSSGNTASTTIGRAAVQYVVQFRGTTIN